MGKSALAILADEERREDGVYFELPLSEDEPPTEIQLFRMGWNETTKGNFLFDTTSGEKVMAFYKRHRIATTSDYEHQSQYKPPIIAPASSIHRIELRDDGLWATDIKWTKRADELIRAKEYLFFSPAFDFDVGSSRITRYVNFALTNGPATHSQAPLIAASEGAPDHTPEGSAAMANYACCDQASRAYQRLGYPLGKAEAKANAEHPRHPTQELMSDLETGGKDTSATAAATAAGDASMNEIEELRESLIAAIAMCDQMLGGTEDVEAMKTMEPAALKQKLSVLREKLAGRKLTEEPKKDEEEKKADAPAAMAAGTATMAARDDAFSNLAQLTEKTSPQEQIAQVLAWKLQAEQVPSLTERVTLAEKTERFRRFDDLIRQGKDEKKFSPAQAEELAKKYREQETGELIVRELLSVSTPAHVFGQSPTPPAGHTEISTMTLTDDGKKAASVMGFTEAEVLAHAKKLAEAGHQ